MTNGYKFIGVIFTANGSFLSTRTLVVKQARKALYLFYTENEYFNPNAWFAVKIVWAKRTLNY